MRGDTAWWVRRAYGTTGTLEDDVFVTEYSSISQLASWVLRQNGRAVPLEPHELKQEVGAALRRVREGHEGAPPQPAREKAVRHADGVVERPAGPVAPERFAVLQALLAYLLAACGEERTAEIPAAELLEKFPSVPADELEEHLSLLNLVNFGGGCYTVYAELQGGTVHVDKELWGDTFRAAPRLTPLEARAIRLALEYVGPMIAAEAHSPLARVRKKLEETFGQFELERRPSRTPATTRRISSRRSPAASASSGSSRSSTRRRRTRRRRRGSSSRIPSGASCRTGTSTRGTARAAASARSGSTGCAARR